MKTVSSFFASALLFAQASCRFDGLGAAQLQSLRPDSDPRV